MDICPHENPFDLSVTDTLAEEGFKAGIVLQKLIVLVAFASSWWPSWSREGQGKRLFQASGHPRKSMHRLISSSVSRTQRVLLFIRKRREEGSGGPPLPPHASCSNFAHGMHASRCGGGLLFGWSIARWCVWCSSVHENKPFCSIISFRGMHLYLCVCIYTNTPTYKDEPGRRNGKKLYAEPPPVVFLGSLLLVMTTGPYFRMPQFKWVQNY